MQPAFPYRIKGQQLWLSPHRCLFWEEEKSLILSDLHFGKTGHFRKAGIAVPQSVYREDLLRLLSLIQNFQPRQLLVVGDFFHSRENKELSLFRRWRDDFPDLGIRLVLGNHDILREDWYEQAGITLSQELRIGPFAFIHDIGEMGGGIAAAGLGDVDRATGLGEMDRVTGLGDAARPYFFSGHLHPGIRIRGMGKQSLQFPCFYFGAEYAVLPAFGHFTGTVSVDLVPGSNVFAILPPSGGEDNRAGHRSGGAGLAGSTGLPDAGGKESSSPVRRAWSGMTKGSGSIFQIQ